MQSRAHPAEAMAKNERSMWRTTSHNPPPLSLTISSGLIPWRGSMKHLLKALAVLILAGTEASAQPLSDLVIFSGSLSDSGNFSSAFGDLPPPFFQNRTTNGPNSVDVFASYFGFSAEPSLHLIGKLGGNNFSVLGSRASGSDPIDLPAQLDAYFARHGGRADPESLYLVFIGGHEVRQAVFEPDDAIASKIINDTVKGNEVALRRLVKAGARKLYAPNFIDLAITPEARLKNVVERAHTMSLRYNRLFEEMLDRVECDLGIDIARFNFQGFIDNALVHANEIGFTNLTDSCLALLPEGRCDFNAFLFFNEVFPTARIHRLIGEALAHSYINRTEIKSGRICKRLTRLTQRRSSCRKAGCRSSIRSQRRHLISLLRR